MNTTIFYNVEKIDTPVGAIDIEGVMWDVVPMTLVNLNGGYTNIKLVSHKNGEKCVIIGFDEVDDKQIQGHYDEDDDLVITVI